MTNVQLHQTLRRILEEQPGSVGKLTYIAEEELCRSFDQLMRTTRSEGATPDEVLQKLNEFGTALDRIGIRYARLIDCYERLYLEATCCLFATGAGVESHAAPVPPSDSA